MADAPLRDFIYLDFDRVRSLAAQLGVPISPGGGGGGDAAAADRVDRERLVLRLEPALIARGNVLRVGPEFEFENKWVPETFADGQFVLRDRHRAGDGLLVAGPGA